VASPKFTARLLWRDTLFGTEVIRVPQVRLQFRLRDGFRPFSEPIRCQWDSGAELSVLSEELARDLGADLRRKPDTKIFGVTGEGEAWIVPLSVYFEGLRGYQFEVRFLVQKGSDSRLPLLGMFDTAKNFDIVSTEAEEYHFFLARRHVGLPLLPDEDPEAD
jgi:hypothetical protein